MRALLVLPLLIAGCVSPPVEDTAPAASFAPAPIVLTDCHQMHLHFPARAEDFAAQVPSEFTILTGSAGTTTLYVFIDRCTADDGTPASQMWIELPVEPDASLDPVEGYHRFLLQAITDHAGLHAALAAQGFEPALELGQARVDHPVGVGALSTQATFVAARGEYGFTTMRSTSSGAFGEESMLRWAIDADGVAHVLSVAASESKNLGAGVVHFTYSGGDAAPPTAQGIAHEVYGATVTIAPVEVA